MNGMKKLVESVVRATLGEDKKPKVQNVVGVYVGRFQPFHAGHFNTYNEMVKEFGHQFVYIATSNVSGGDRHPFNFREKQKIISKIYGIKKDHIVQEKNVYSPINILSKFDAETTALAVGVGKKDSSRLGGKYYKRFTGKNMKGFEDEGYIYIVPTFKLKVGGTNISGTAVRKVLSSPDIDDSAKKKLFKVIFGKFNSNMYDFITNRLMFDHKEEKGILLTKEVVENFFVENDINKIIKEASTNTTTSAKRGHAAGGPSDDGPGTFYQSFSDYYRVSKDAVPWFMQKTGWSVVEYMIKDKDDEVLDPDMDFTMIYNPISAVTFGRAGSIAGDKKPIQNYKARLTSIVERLGWEIIQWMGMDASGKKWKAGVTPSQKPNDEYGRGKTQWSSTTGTKGEVAQLKDAGKGEGALPVKRQRPDDEVGQLNLIDKQKPLQHKVRMTEKFDLTEEVNLLVEGGAYGHLSHPFDDNNLTFRDFKTIITNTLTGELSKEKPVTEKTDGQNIMISWRDGKLIAARNKGHLRDKGASALTTAGISKMFAGRGDLHTAFSSAMVDLEAAISALSDAQKDKIFKEGEQFMSLEIIYPKTANVIPYEKSLLIFHGVIQYDETGAPIGDMSSFARMLAGMIKQIDKDVQGEFAIEYPPVVELPKVKDFSKRKRYYIGKLNSLQKKYKLKTSNTLGDYHQAFWTDYITKATKKTKVKLPESVFTKLVKRWAFFDKSYKLSQVKKDLKKLTDKGAPKFLDWVLETDKEDHKAISKENILPWEKLFLELGAEIMLNLSMLLTANPEAGAQKIKTDLESTIKAIQSTGDLSLIGKLEGQLKKLEAIGGFGSIVSSEGITFTYGDKLYKFTGTFAPINQILGLLKYI
jgi:hypothetical protein